MRCQRCGTEVPNEKIYCEKCGTAIQMVPDYNPVDDISIGSDEEREKERSSEKPEASDRRKFCQRCGITGAVFLLFGFLVFQTAYHRTVSAEDAAAEVEEPKEEKVNKPQFGLPPGTYSYSPTLRISHAESEKGAVYFTTDGTTPDEQSTAYQAPIALREGTTVVRAVFIREDGLQSEEISGTYQVVFQYPDEPVFSVPGGSYEAGFSVVITAGEDCKIYYTTNGEEPGPQAKVYQGPVFIAPGLTVLQAVSVDADGGTSGIVEAIYNVSENSGAMENESDGVPTDEAVIP